ncbi:hypothetical protein C0V70_04270 [Bacteriovorax stolpii]|uniref:Uncharacterized protein n=1 Tax=Bacteriovorax stolpii TaxID=960 RepID=A0A2K9NPB1_BACTC|nr:DUF6602 domain-containing protein [Bacteriovorax stolpii]AUN97338.1 hypothetical protein C0V70_04270 [Bacteriovorax stolpii]TDP52510.1 hypothetical protein C8D79_2274 [Bacteriovorax stolpii]
MVKKINVQSLFQGLQDEMLSSLGVLKIGHAPTLGDFTEINWLELFKCYLPRRYMADRAFVVDSEGLISDAIDIVIYDAFYSPFLLNKNGIKFVPAESVYAVFEVKQDISKNHIEYAGKKASSVRKLKRTSVKINNAGKLVEPKAHFEIIAGLLCTKNSWASLSSSKENIKKHFLKLKKNEKLNISCCLKVGSICLNEEEVQISPQKDALLIFFFNFLQLLQTIGTTPAMDIKKYLSNLE